MILTIILTLCMGNKTGEVQGKIMADKKKQVQAFLNNISKVESSGGTNFNHPEVQNGIQKGDKAIGRYGLMPNTVYEVVNRMRLNGEATPDILKLKDLAPDDLKAHLEQNPQLEDQVAQSLAGRVLQRQPDEDAAAFSWHNGHNLAPDRVSSQDYMNDSYVQKYNKLKDGDSDE